MQRRRTGVIALATSIIVISVGTGATSSAATSATPESVTSPATQLLPSPKKDKRPDKGKGKEPAKGKGKEPDKGKGKEKEKPPPTGKLRVKVKKSAAATARVAITGSDGFSTLTGTSTTFTKLTVGTYRIRAEKTTAPGGKVTVKVSKKKVRIRPDKKSKVRVTYKFTPDPPAPAPLDSTPPAPVANLLIGQATESTVAMSWSNPTDADFTEVLVRRTQGDAPPMSPSDGVAVPLRAALANSTVDRGLSRDTKYSYSVFTRDATGNINPIPASASTRTASEPAPDTIIYTAGDIAQCELGAVADTAALLASVSTTEPFVAPGDLVYPDGTPEDFLNCYYPHFGQFRDRTWAVPGNHEYNSGAVGYFDYFGPRVGTQTDPWYSVDFGEWHFVMLNSNCWAVGGCKPDSRQYQWLAQDLAANPRRCIAAVWHHPLYSSGAEGDGGRAAVGDMWRLLMDHGADLLLTGHQHSYERFPRLDNAGTRTPDGLRQVIVGTGGAPLRQFKSENPMSEYRQNDTHGMLRLTLGAGQYSWNFLPTVIGAQQDTGSDSC